MCVRMGEWMHRYVLCADGCMDGCVHLHACMHACMHARCMYVCMYPCMYACIYIYIYRYISMCVYIYIASVHMERYLYTHSMFDVYRLCLKDCVHGTPPGRQCSSRTYGRRVQGLRA